MKVSFKGWYHIPNAYVARRGVEKLGLTSIISPKMTKKGLVGVMRDKNNSLFVCVRDDMDKVYEKFMKRIGVTPKKVENPFK